MNRRFLGILGLFVLLAACPVSASIRDVALNSHLPEGSEGMRYLIEADEFDGIGSTNRHKLTVTADALLAGGSYTPQLVMSRSRDGAVVAAQNGVTFSFVSAVSMPRLFSVELDPRVAATASVVSVGTEPLARRVSLRVVQAGRGYLQAPTVRITYASRLSSFTPLLTKTRTTTAVLDSATGAIISIPEVTLDPDATGSGISVSVDPPPPLDPDETYDVTLRLRGASGLTLSRSVVSSSKWIHFVGTDAASAALNAVVRVTGNATVSRPVLNRNPAATPNDGQFAVSIPCNIYRYDNWTAAGAAASNSMTPAFSVALQDNAATPVVIDLEEPNTDAVSLAQYSGSGNTKKPSIYSGNITVRFRPTSSAFSLMNFLRQTYQITLARRTPGDELETQLSADPATLVVNNQVLAPLSGTLNFSSIPTAMTAIPSGSVPAALSSGASIALTLNVGAATVQGSPSVLSYSGTGLRVLLQSNGDCLFQNTVDAADDDWLSASCSVAAASDIAEINSVVYQRSNYKLGPTGLTATTLVDLPAGVLWNEGNAAQRDKMRFKSQILFAGVGLNSNREAQTSASYTAASGSIYLAEETKPLIFSGSVLQWEPAFGRFELLGALGVYSFARVANEYLQALPDGTLANNDVVDDPADPADTVSGNFKRSNDFVHSMASNPTKVMAMAASGTPGDLAGGSGLLTAEYGLLQTDYRTHMPYNAFISAPSGKVKVENDVISSDDSALLNVNVLAIHHQRQCSDEACVATADMALQEFEPAGQVLRLTAGGGLHGSGSVNSPPLKWGRRPDGSYAHQLAAAFTQGSFMAADTFALQQADPALGAFAALNTGYRDDGATLKPEAPSTGSSSDYLKGEGDYPGLNFRIGVGISPSVEGSSTLGDADAFSYPMHAQSKYYTRWGGVSGIHSTTLGTKAVSIYGYDITFSKFGFNLLSGAMRDSLIEGGIAFAGPANFTQSFEQLQLTCSGELGELKPVTLAGEPTKVLDHWDAAFEVLGASFVRSDLEACAGGSGKYVTNIRTGVHHLPVSLIGNLGLHPDGEVISPADGCMDGEKLITSRFVLPRNIEIQGPARANGAGHEVWNYSSVQDAYLSDYAAGVTAHSKGFWNLIGTLDVPFFRDLQVNLQLLAITTLGAPSDPDSEIHVMGGWPDGGWLEGGKSPYELAIFDEENVGLPPATTLEEYRGIAAAAPPLAAAAAGSSGFSVKAAQTWLEVVDFDYELTWDPVRKTFEAKPVSGTDILVINIGHNCLRISPDFAEINFGFSYDGLPQVNLSQMAFNAVDDATGAASSLLHTLGSAGFNALTGGVDRFAKLVGDRMDQVIDEHVDAIMGPPLDALDSALQGQFSIGAKVDSAPVMQAVDNVFDVGTGAVGAIKTQMDQLINAGGSAVSLSKNLVAQLDQVLNALDACANLKHHGVLPASAVEPYAEGLFDTYTNPANSPLQVLARELVTDLAAAITAEVLNAVWAEIIAKHEDKVFAVEELLAKVYAKVKLVRDQLNDVTSDFNQELQQIVAAAKAAGEIEAAMNRARDQIKATIAALSDMEVTVRWDLISDDLKAQWLQSIKDQLHTTPFVTKISTAIKERLYDLEARMHSAIDSGMDALNDILKDAIRDQLAGLDESINNLLGGKLDDIVGAGQIKGYAHITTDSLELLRLDGSFRWMVPDEMKLDAYLEIRSMNSTGEGTCAGAASDSTEVELGALDVPLEWISPDLRADVSAKFAFGGGSLIGFGGGFRMVGELSYETFTITDMQAQIAFGETENYLAAEVGLAFSSYQLKGGIFFGRCCTPDPIEAIDPDVAALIPGPSFTGAYAYGQGWIPIIGNGCFFNISAGVGAGAFYFAEGPTYGGKMFAGVSGEALCAVSVKGEIELIGVKSGGNFSFSGEGRISGKAGVCPFCVKFSKTVQATYSNGSWDVDY